MPAFTFFATAEAIPRPAPARLLRRGPRDDVRHRGDGRAALTPRTRALMPSTCSATRRRCRDRGIGRAGPGGRGAGPRREARRADGRLPGPPRPSASSPRRTSAASATAARSPPTTTRWRRPRACASTAPRQDDATRVGYNPASTSCRRLSCACCCRSWTPGPRPAARPRKPTPTPPWRPGAAAAATQGRRPLGTCTSCARARASWGGPERGRDRRARLLRGRSIASRRSRRPRPAATCPSPTTWRGPASHSRSSRCLTAPAADEVVAVARRRSRPDSPDPATARLAMRLWSTSPTPRTCSSCAPCASCARRPRGDVTARGFAQTLELAALRDRGDRDRPPPAGVAAKGSASCSAPTRSWAGRAATGGSTSRWRTARRTSLAAALLRIPSATTFDYEWARSHTVNCRMSRRWWSRTDPARAA